VAGSIARGVLVLVTGASSGVGQATARLFADRGARGSSPFGRAGVEMLRLDIRSEESVQRCVDEVMTPSGSIDVPVNDAGATHEGFAEETTPADAAAVMDIDLFGTVRVTHVVLPGMRVRRQGRIINVGSLAAWVGEPGEAFYAASKAAPARCTETPAPR
jgi:NAD(P)-dependent dehydrogenase (short-subunit alcohol dehydrogenase family)